MSKAIPFPMRQGVHSRQAHADLPEQGIFEREVSREGFFGAATHFHHKHAPTSWTGFEGELKPRLFDTRQINHDESIPWMSSLLLHNPFVQYRFWCLSQAMSHLVRNADGDELLFVHAGSGALFCDYGHLAFAQGDYILIPRGTLWRLEPEWPCQILMIQATNDSFWLPDKGLLGHHAIFDPAVLDTPCLDKKFQAQQDEQDWLVVVKRSDRYSRIRYPYNPLDAIGWHGDVCVVRLNWRDIRPVMSHRYHIPPSVHATFTSTRFVICTFVPRPIETDPGALKVPFYHSNEDYEEVLFYHMGNFFSRDNIDAGMLSFHPCGFSHGPHPKAYQAGLAATHKQTDEVAVMLDTRDALEIAPLASEVEIQDYYLSWQEGK